MPCEAALGVKLGPWSTLQSIRTAALLYEHSPLALMHREGVVFDHIDILFLEETLCRGPRCIFYASDLSKVRFRLNSLALAFQKGCSFVPSVPVTGAPNS